MKSKKVKNLGLSFEKKTISKLMQTTVGGGANIQFAYEQTDKGHTCDYTWCY